MAGKFQTEARMVSPIYPSNACRGKVAKQNFQKRDLDAIVLEISLACYWTKGTPDNGAKEGGSMD